MKEYLKDKNIRLRCRKNYPEAHTHVVIGKVVSETAAYIAVKGRSFHFRRISDQMRNQIHTGESMVRIIPWNNVEIVHWISEKADWEVDFTFDKSGNLILNDKVKTVIAARQDSME